MIYNNLFKPNKGSSSKDSLYYLIQSRKYKFSFIFDKKSVSILSGMSLGVVIILCSNLLFYGILNANNARKIDELKNGISEYESAISQISSMQAGYNDILESVDAVYNISDKSTKWSVIVESIAEQLPYDSVLTSIQSVTEEQIAEIEEAMVGDIEMEEEETDNYEDDYEVDGEEYEDEEEEEEELDEDGNVVSNSIKNLKKKNIVLITGKSLSMVNISLFLDKLDSLHIFSKIENLDSTITPTQDYYEFVIYATLR